MKVYGVALNVDGVIIPETVKEFYSWDAANEYFDDLYDEHARDQIVVKEYGIFIDFWEWDEDE